ncbi:MAG: cupin domain-containing protein [Candidatus Omnitrophica bacterium]|nr:cupin domain-containing protein [Candidatus Omnitrophota bacterium]
MRPVSFRQQGKLVSRQAKGLRAGVVALKPGEIMEWHSTRTREELLIALEGQLRIEVQSSGKRRGQRVRRLTVNRGQCVFLPRRTIHRVVNQSSECAHYIYVTGVVET